jgi:ribosomal-protein-alanine N-acetyltransferase
MNSKPLRLIPIDDELLLCLDGGAAFGARYGASISGHEVHARSLVGQSLEFYGRIAATPPWTGYLGVDSNRDVVIGTCGFKGNPSSARDVEIAYHTFPEYEGQGFATAMARELVEVARASPDVCAVVAHTLPQPNASTRVLQKVGFTHAGLVVDPEDGPVWQWRLAVS